MSPTDTGRHRCSGFTVVELLVTVVIISILASAVYPLVALTRQRNKEQDLQRALFALRLALDAYKDAVEDGLILRQVGDSGYPPSLHVLVDGVPNARSPSGAKLYFLRRIPRDPFADPGIPAEKTWGLRSYQSPASEPKEGKDVYDVYSLTPGAGRNGIPYRVW